MLGWESKNKVYLQEGIENGNPLSSLGLKLPCTSTSSPPTIHTHHFWWRLYMSVMIIF